MINWEELKHIHVIRKLEQILSQWFNTEVFFLDERGTIKNYDPMDRQREFKNPLCATLLPKEKGRELLLSSFTHLNDKLFQAGQPHMVFEGPVGVEKVVASPILIDGEFFGSVMAYSFI